MKIRTVLNSKERNTGRKRSRGSEGFSFIESMVGMMLLGITLGGLLTGISTVSSIIAYGREEAKAVEIVSETLDSIRLYSWNQITNPAFMPKTFVVQESDSGHNWSYGTNDTDTTTTLTKTQSLNYTTLTTSEPVITDADYAAPDTTTTTEPEPSTTSSAQESGYVGSILVSDAPITEGYGSQVKMVTVQLEWVSHDKTNRTEMRTLITQYGLQGRIVN